MNAERIEEFGRCRTRLEAAVAATCRRGGDWPGTVAAAVHAVVEFAAADPDAALVLTERASSRWNGREPEFVAMVDHFARQLGRGAPDRNPRLPDERAVVARIARQVGLQLEAGRREEMMEIAPDLTFLALLPYLGFAGARRWSAPTATA